MSILIKNIKMPERCAKCFLKQSCEKRIYMERRPENCPLVEIPTPHGDLIDRGVLMDGWRHLKDAVKYGNKTAEQQEHSYSMIMMYEVALEIDEAPTIIGAEPPESCGDCNHYCTGQFFNNEEICMVTGDNAPYDISDCPLRKKEEGRE